MRTGDLSGGRLLIAVFIAALVGCALGCTIAMKMLSPASSPDDPPPAEGDGHDWLHDQLGTSAEQKEALEEIERAFEKTEMELKAALAAATENLGSVIESEGDYTVAVEAAVEEVHKEMAKYQKHSIEHLFMMRPALTPEQFKLLLKLAGEALGRENSDELEHP